MLATIIQRYDNKHLIPRARLKFYRLSGATFYDCINSIYQFIKPFLDNKMSVFEEYGAFKKTCSKIIHLICARFKERSMDDFMRGIFNEDYAVFRLFLFAL